MKTWQKYAAEFYGTLVMVGIGTGTIIALGAWNIEADITTVALAFGFAWMTALYTVGRVSGGHFNPALTLAAFLDKRISAQDMLGYWVSQSLGAFAASGIFALVLNRAAVGGSYTYLYDAAVGGPVDGVSGFLAEAIFTMVLTAAFLVLLKSTAHTKYLGMGFSLTALTFIGLRFTGASMNPFRSLAPAILGEGVGAPLDPGHALWVFIAGPLVGAVLGWVVYKFVVEGDMDLADDIKDLA
jgi:aquaporin Z